MKNTFESFCNNHGIELKEIDEETKRKMKESAEAAKKNIEFYNKVNDSAIRDIEGRLIN